LYDRHILKQKVIIQLSVPTIEQKKMRSSGGDKVVQEVGQLSQWYLTHRAQRTEDERMHSEFPEAVDLTEEDVVIISDTEEAEGALQEEDDDPVKLPIDLNQGCPDYQTMWVAGALFKNKSGTECSAARLCGQSHRCLRCRARETGRRYPMGDDRPTSCCTHSFSEETSTMEAFAHEWYLGVPHGSGRKFDK
jgi:NACalpha-BTF3-like transcription factor